MSLVQDYWLFSPVPHIHLSSLPPHLHAKFFSILLPPEAPLSQICPSIYTRLSSSGMACTGSHRQTGVSQGLTDALHLPPHHCKHRLLCPTVRPGRRLLCHCLSGALRLLGRQFWGAQSPTQSYVCSHDQPFLHHIQTKILLGPFRGG